MQRSDLWLIENKGNGIFAAKYFCCKVFLLHSMQCISKDALCTGGVHPNHDMCEPLCWLKNLSTTPCLSFHFTYRHTPLVDQNYLLKLLIDFCKTWFTFTNYTTQYMSVALSPSCELGRPLVTMTLK